MKSLLAALALSTALSAAAPEYFVFVGTYTGPESKGIYGFKFKPADGSLAPLGLLAETSNPSWVSVHPNGRFLYAANENEKGTVTAFAIDPASGKLTALNTVSSHGAGPCHLSFDRTGKFLFAANYDGGSIAVLPILPDGRLGEATAAVQHHGSGFDKERQAGPHAHFIAASADNRFVYVADLGLDEILSYKFDAAKGTLTPNTPPFYKGHPGAGPRHIAFSPNGKAAYLFNEMGSSVVALDYNGSKGTFKEEQVLSSLPADFKGENSGAEILVDASGKFVYASNRGHESIAVFAVRKRGLQLVQNASTLGKEPRHFAFDPTGAYMLVENQKSNSIAVFHVDPKTGLLRPNTKMVSVPTPICIAFLPVP
jgi:6-phosphogluconolactonase